MRGLFAYISGSRGQKQDSLNEVTLGRRIHMKEIPAFDIELSQSVDYILGSGLAKKAFEEPPFKNYGNILVELIESIDRLADNCHMPEFTNHAMPHVCSIVKRASEWGEKDGWLQAASPGEAACLLMALAIHDIGMLSQDSKNLPDGERENYIKGLSDLSNWVRRTHVIRIDKLVKSLLADYLKDHDQNLKAHLNVIIGMAESHDKWPWEPGFVSREEDILQAGLKAERVAAFNGVIAVCDLLDEDCSRCDTLTLLRHHHGTTENRAHWLRHGLTKRVDGVKDHRVVIELRRLDCPDPRMEMVYRTLRNHYRLIKLYNESLKHIQGEITYVEFSPGDGIPEAEDEISKGLEVYREYPEFRHDLAPQLMTTFMKEARNQDGEDEATRRRLDRIGLERVDLSQMKEFFRPASLLYPEERVIRGAGNVEDRLGYARGEAEKAYRNGEIEKLRQICGEALKLAGRHRIPLKQKYWALAYTLIYETGTMDFYEARENHHNSLMPMGPDRAIGLSDSPCQGLLDVLLCFLEPRISQEYMEEYRDHLMEYDYSLMDYDSATALLVRTVVGLFWFWDRDGENWSQVSEHIRRTAGAGSLFRMLEEQEKRLRLQYKILHGNEAVDRQELEESGQPVMARAWYDFYQADWQKVSEDIPQMVQLAQKNQDLFCAVQGFQNMTSRIIQWILNKTEENTEEGLYGGVYRYQRQSGESAIFRFWKTRESCIETTLLKNMINPTNSSDKRASVLRLISLRRLEALENWNLGEYLESVRNESQWLYDTAVYKDENRNYQGYRGNLPEAVIALIQGMDSKALPKEKKQELAAMMYRHFPEGFNKVADFILSNNQKCMWAYGVEWLEYLISEFDGERLSGIVKWLVQYDEFKKTQRFRFNLAEYKFLEQVAERFTEEDWTVIMPIVETLYKSYHLYHVNESFAVKCLEFMPLKDCEKMLAVIGGWPPDQFKRETVYKVSIALSGTRGTIINRQLHELIRTCKQTDSDRSYDQLDRLIDIKNLLELKTIDIEGICQAAETTLETLAAIDLTGFNLDYLKNVNEKFVNQNWSLAPEEKALWIIRRFCGFLKDHRGKLSKPYFAALCRLLNSISNTGTENERREIGDFFVREYVLNDDAITIEDTRFEHKDSPLNGLHLNFFTKEVPESSVFLILANCGREIPRQYHQQCLRWGLKQISRGPDQMYYYGTFLHTYYYFQGDQMTRQTAMGGLMYIRGQMEADGMEFEKKLSHVLKALSHLKNMTEWFDGQPFSELARQDFDFQELFLKPLEQVKERSAVGESRHWEM